MFGDQPCLSTLDSRSQRRATSHDNFNLFGFPATKEEKISSLENISVLQARKYGVRAAMPGFIGKRLCPELVFAKPDFQKYTAASKEVQEGMGPPYLLSCLSNFSQGLRWSKVSCSARMSSRLFLSFSSIVSSRFSGSVSQANQHTQGAPGRTWMHL